jgi:hypothetical protein
MKELIALLLVCAAACPPYWQCTPKGDWNHPNCKCWDSK